MGSLRAEAATGLCLVLFLLLVLLLSVLVLFDYRQLHSSIGYHGRSNWLLALQYRVCIDSAYRFLPMPAANGLVHGSCKAGCRPSSTGFVVILHAASCQCRLQMAWYTVLGKPAARRQPTSRLLPQV